MQYAREIFTKSESRSLLRIRRCCAAVFVRSAPQKYLRKFQATEPTDDDNGRVCTHEGVFRGPRCSHALSVGVGADEGGGGVGVTFWHVSSQFPNKRNIGGFKSELFHDLYCT